MQNPRWRRRGRSNHDHGPVIFTTASQPAPIPFSNLIMSAAVVVLRSRKPRFSIAVAFLDHTLCVHEPRAFEAFVRLLLLRLCPEGFAPTGLVAKLEVIPPEKQSSTISNLRMSLPSILIPKPDSRSGRNFRSHR